MSFLEKLLRPKSRLYNEDIPPVENDPVGLIVARRNALSNGEDQPVEQIVKMPAAMEQPLPKEAAAPALKPKSEEVKKAEQPYDPLLFLLKVNHERVAEKQDVALEEASENRPGDETAAAGQKLATSDTNHETVSPPVWPVIPAIELLPARAEAAGENADHNIQADSNKETSDGEIEEQSAVVPVSDPALAGEDTISPPALEVEMAPPNQKADGGGILDIFREEIGDESRAIAVPLEQIDIQALWEESVEIRDMLNRRCRH